jgi:hypothetical protein
MLPLGVDDASYGPFALFQPMLFPNGAQETAYYVSSNGVVSFEATPSDTLQPSIGRIITAALGILGQRIRRHVPSHGE